MTTHLPTEALDAIQHYLERQFPDCTRRTWWDENMQAQIFELTNSDSLCQIGIEAAIFQNPTEGVQALRESDLADYIRESRAPRKWFRVTWNDGGLHILSKPL